MIHKLSRGRYRLEVLTLSCFIPDIEVPILYLLGFQPARLILHSIIGTVILSPVVIMLIKPIYYRILRAMRINVNPEEVNHILEASILGSLSHVFLDALHHDYNPLLWPLTSESMDILILFGNWILATYILHAIFIFLTVILFIKAWRKSNGFLDTIKTMLSKDY